MEVQLEFNFDNKSPEEMTLHLMQQQIDKIFLTTEKVRKKLFAELGDVKKACVILQQENNELRSILKEIHHDKTDRHYRRDGYLFDVRKSQELAS